MSMTRGSKAAAAVALLAVYGLAIFFGTRAYYKPKPAGAIAFPEAPRRQALAGVGPGALPPNHPDVSGLVQQLASTDPVSLANAADAAFGKKDYVSAAKLYARALDLAPDNADLYNNLGLTLFYLDRADEALEKLRKGAELHPEMQRIWLTLGFVQSNTQRVADARNSLQKAVALGADTDVGREARRQLDRLSK
jgi:tetratricopeptide (TPR) repeat protein